jgi:hypothetical protein
VSRGKGKAKMLAAVESDLSGEESDGAQDVHTTVQALRREIEQLREQNSEQTDAVKAIAMQLGHILADCNAVLPPEVISSVYLSP